MTHAPIYQPETYIPPPDYFDSGPHVFSRQRPPVSYRTGAFWRYFRLIAGLLTLRHFPGGPGGGGIY